MKLIPIKRTINENEEFSDHPDCKQTLQMSVDFYENVGYSAPWIGYYARKKNQYVGSAGFKGGPVNGKVEIAYGTFERYRKQGLGTEMCRQLVELALEADSSIVITARTLPEKNYSTRILEKNDFELLGTVIDEEDGKVWEWKFKNTQSHNKS